MGIPKAVERTRIDRLGRCAAPLSLTTTIQKRLLVVHRVPRAHRGIARTHPRTTFSSTIIDSLTHPNPTRDILSTTPSLVSAQELASRSPTPTQHALTSPQALIINSPSASLVPATRSRSELEQGSSADLLSSSIPATDPEHTRARKRQRTDIPSPLSFSNRTTVDQPTRSSPPQRMMRISESDYESSFSITPDSPVHAGPSSLGGQFDGLVVTNGHTNGFTPAVNGSSGGGAMMGNGVSKHGKGVAKVNLPGTTLYDDSFVDREEFVRLVIQSLRDVGYIESAATLEAESGYAMESPEVSEFRQYILDGLWSKAEMALERLGVQEDEGLWDAKFLISQQKYLELLEARKATEALHVLRNELAPLNVDPDQLHTLSSLIMCSEPEDLRRRAHWDGASGTSRQQLLDTLHDYIPATVMIPQRRFSALLHQARAYQRQQCIYHNSPLYTFSLYSDHRCNKSDFPRITTTILEVHSDEVWNIEWSHDGNFLASASKDKSAIIWKRGSSGSSIQDWAAHLILRDHPYSVGCLAWSLDDSILLTTAEHFIKMWNVKTGVCIRTLDDHTETVTAVSWLPDGTGFITGALDRKVIIWDADGKVRDAWNPTAIRLTDLAVTPDFTRLVAIGMEVLPTPASEPTQSRGAQAGDTPSISGGNSGPVAGAKSTHRMIVFDLATKETESSTPLEGDLTSVQTSQDSQYALINHAPNEVHLWDLHTGRVARKYEGQIQGRHVIRSCFGGIDGNFVVSGSEDANVYIWHRESGALLEVLAGHGEGSVNSVAWNPTNERMFASCSDDHTIRIWEAPPPGAYVAEPPLAEPPSSHPSSSSFTVEKGKGKTRQRQDGKA